MEVTINLEKIALNNLDGNSYLVLWSIANSQEYVWLTNTKEDKALLDTILKKLEDDLWIKILEDKIELRSKALKLGIVENDFKEEVKEVVSYLNKKLEKKRGFNPLSKGIYTPTKARLAEGYSVEDLKSVIDEMYAKWSHTHMKQYLRPTTLFNATKFQGYLALVEENISNNNLNEERV